MSRTDDAGYPSLWWYWVFGLVWFGSSNTGFGFFYIQRTNIKPNGSNGREREWKAHNVDVMIADLFQLIGAGPRGGYDIDKIACRKHHTNGILCSPKCPLVDG